MSLRGMSGNSVPGVPIQTGVLGTAGVGNVLSFNAPPGLEWTAVQWYRDGVAISGATNATYTYAAADVGKSITVELTGLAQMSSPLGTSPAGSGSGGSYTLPIATSIQLGGLKPDNVTVLTDATTGATTAPLAPYFKQLPKWAAAVMKARTGVKRARVAYIGDSETLGLGSGSDGATQVSYAANSRKNSYGVQFAALMTKTGFVTMNCHGSAPSGNLANPTAVVTFDPRFNLPNGGWAVVASTAGMLPLSTIVDGSILNFTPTGNVDTFYLDYISDVNQGTFTYAVDGGATTSINAVTTPGPLIIPAGAAGTHTLNIVKTGTTRVTPLVFDAYDSTNPGADSMVFAYNGGKGIDFPAAARATLVRYAPDLTVLCLNTNEMGSLGNTTTFRTNQQLLITNALLTGDCVMMTGAPIPPANATYPRTLAEQQVYIDIYKDLALTNNIPLVDNWSRWVSNAAKQPLGYYNGSIDLHPSMVGNADFSENLFKTTTAI